MSDQPPFNPKRPIVLPQAAQRFFDVELPAQPSQNFGAYPIIRRGQTKSVKRLTEFAESFFGAQRQRLRSMLGCGLGLEEPRERASLNGSYRVWASEERNKFEETATYYQALGVDVKKVLADVYCKPRTADTPELFRLQKVFVGLDQMRAGDEALIL